MFAVRSVVEEDRKDTIIFQADYVRGILVFSRAMQARNQT